MPGSGVGSWAQHGALARGVVDGEHASKHRGTRRRRPLGWGGEGHARGGTQPGARSARPGQRRVFARWLAGMQRAVPRVSRKPRARRRQPRPTSVETLESRFVITQPTWMQRTVSRMSRKPRVWPPLPYTVSGCPTAACTTKRFRAAPEEEGGGGRRKWGWAGGLGRQRGIPALHAACPVPRPPIQRCQKHSCQPIDSLPTSAVPATHRYQRCRRSRTG